MSSFARHRLRDRRSRLQSCEVAALLFGLFAASVHALNPTPDTEHGGALYAARCAQCHDKPAERVPTRLQLADAHPRP